MEYELEEIKIIRKRLGLTQFELAERAGVSQSLIAKVESGKIDPTYTKTKKIFDSLTLLEKKEINIKSIMNKKIIVANVNDYIKDIIKKMRRYGISQLPVTQNKHPVGIISETSLLNKITELKNPSDINKLKVKDVMSECPPIIPITASHKVVMDLLKFYPILLVMQKNQLKGILTKSDLLNVVYKTK